MHALSRSGPIKPFYFQLLINVFLASDIRTGPLGAGCLSRLLCPVKRAASPPASCWSGLVPAGGRSLGAFSTLGQRNDTENPSAGFAVFQELQSNLTQDTFGRIPSQPHGLKRLSVISVFKMY